MRLLPQSSQIAEWPKHTFDRWMVLRAKTEVMEKKIGGGNTFDKMLEQIRELAKTRNIDVLNKLLTRRLAARALTWLWANDEVVGRQLLIGWLIDALFEAQKPRLTRISLLQVAQLYFRYFDRLDNDVDVSLRQKLEKHLFAQLQHISKQRVAGTRPDVLSVLKKEGDWLLTLNGPFELATKTRKLGNELGHTFVEMGLSGFDSGRYGDICRAHYYLETLRSLKPGASSDIFDELLKPSVNKAPYEGGRRIGHAALEILIDRSENDPSEVWQNFILSVAGDPRIASSAGNYQEWWLPLGEARINRVRGWLSKEDLRLFLQAVEEYGKASGNDDLQRMFPARKYFLEGLFKLGLIRNTRLLLGRTAEHSVKKILADEVKTSFAKMDGSMSDKAVIYLDCGDFHLVEGSHSFKIWAYLAQPSPSLSNYDKNNFSHSDLTLILPSHYRLQYPNLKYIDVTHNGLWQQKIIEFLAENGIGLDVEQLLIKQAYKHYLQRYGLPVVNPKRVVVPDPKMIKGTVLRRSAINTNQPFMRKNINISNNGDVVFEQYFSELSDIELKILKYVSENPRVNTTIIAAALGVNVIEITIPIYKQLRKYLLPTKTYEWEIRNAYVDEFRNFILNKKI